MIRIKRVNSDNKASLEHFLLNIFNEMPKINNYFMEIIHGFLPNRTKFWCEKYVAIEEKNILCEVSIAPQSRKNARWHINHLAIGKCSDEIIARLIKYVMNKYGGDGVETFITFVDDKMPEMKELFKQGCSFRECAHLELWTSSSVNMDPSQKNFFIDYNKKYLNQLVELYNNMIFPQFRQSLKIGKDDLKKRFKRAVSKKILYDPSNSSVEGYFLVFNKNGKFFIEVLLSDAFASYYSEILKECSPYLENSSILVKKYHTSYKLLIEALTNIGFSKQESYAILVKDYWSQVSNPKESLLGIRVNIGSPA